jgi:hypothetical protein
VASKVAADDRRSVIRISRLLKGSSAHLDNVNLDRQVIEVDSGGMGFLRPAWDKIVLAVIIALLLIIFEVVWSLIGLSVVFARKDTMCQITTEEIGE